MPRPPVVLDHVVELRPQRGHLRLLGRRLDFHLIDQLLGNVPDELAPGVVAAAPRVVPGVRAAAEPAMARGLARVGRLVLGKQRAKWEAVFKQTRQRLAQGTFSPELVAKLEGLAK